MFKCAVVPGYEKWRAPRQCVMFDLEAVRGIFIVRLSGKASILKTLKLGFQITIKLT